MPFPTVCLPRSLSISVQCDFIRALGTTGSPPEAARGGCQLPSARGSCLIASHLLRFFKVLYLFSHSFCFTYMFVPTLQWADHFWQMWQAYVKFLGQVDVNNGEEFSTPIFFAIPSCSSKGWQLQIYFKKGGGNHMGLSCQTIDLSRHRRSLCCKSRFELICSHDLRTGAFPWGSQGVQMHRPEMRAPPPPTYAHYNPLKS